MRTNRQGRDGRPILHLQTGAQGAAAGRGHPAAASPDASPLPNHARADRARLGDEGPCQSADRIDGWLDEARLIIGNTDEIITSDSTFSVPTAAWPLF